MVDLDEEVFEIYGGCYKKDKALNKRWQDVGNDSDTIPAFVKSLTFEEVSKLTEKGFVDSFNDGKYAEDVEEEVVEKDDAEYADYEHEGDKDDHNTEFKNFKNKGQPKA